MVNAVFNPGATIFEGETLPAGARRGPHRAVEAGGRRSPDGFPTGRSTWTAGITPDHSSFEEQWGVEDPRITPIDDELPTSSTPASRRRSAGVPGASTDGLRHFERHGVIQPPEDKDAALFPATFDGRWALIHRPAPAMSGLGAHIWLSWSPDLRHWGDAHGSCCPPDAAGGGTPTRSVWARRRCCTDRGWLLCYHGVRATVSGSIYRVGLALLDRDDPSKVDRPWRRVGLRSADALRAFGRRARRGLPVRLGPRRRWRHAPPSTTARPTASCVSRPQACGTCSAISRGTKEGTRPDGAQRGTLGE